jgi:hypothetical protein
MANYVLEGLINSILNEKELVLLRENVEVMIVPFMDKDGVENGEQGKNRIPRDHNRDYDKESIHHSTKALRTIVPHWSEEKLRIALDLHCPWIKGEGNEYVYLVGNNDISIENNQKIFSRLLEQNSTGDIKYHHGNFLPYGISWNTDKNYNQGMSFSRWANNLDGISFASTLEFPYANVSGKMVSKDGARIFGKAIAFSIKEYLEMIGLE